MNEAAKPRRFDPTPRSMDQRAFVDKFGGVYEHFPEIAMRAFGNGLTPRPTHPRVSRREAKARLPSTSRITVTSAPTRLAAARRRRFTVLVAIQAIRGAGLDRCTPDEFQRFQEWKRPLKRKIEFPSSRVSAKTGKKSLRSYPASTTTATRIRPLAEIDKIANEFTPDGPTGWAGYRRSLIGTGFRRRRCPTAAGRPEHGSDGFRSRNRPLALLKAHNSRFQGFERAIPFARKGTFAILSKPARPAACLVHDQEPRRTTWVMRAPVSKASITESPRRDSTQIGAVKKNLLRLEPRILLFRLFLRSLHEAPPGRSHEANI